MIELRGYKIEDYMSIQDAVEPFCVNEGDYSITEHGVAISATDGGVMACGGIVYAEEGGVAWIKISKKCKDNAYVWARTIKEAFKLMLESVDIPVHAYVVKGFCQGDRLARAMGMKKTDETIEMNGNLYYKYMVA